MNQLTTIDDVLTGVKGELISTISNYNWSLIPEFQLHAAKLALTKNSYIENIAMNDLVAVKDAIIKAGILGLDLTEGKNQGWLLPRKTQKKVNNKYITAITLQVGYKGVEKIHQRMNVIDRLVVRTVYEKDTFEWSGDDQEKPKHEAEWFAKDRGKAAGVYAITYYPDKSINITAAGIDEIYEKHRNISDSWKSDVSKNTKYSPWSSHEKAMIEKTIVYIASKQWPASNKNDEITESISNTLQEIDYSDYRESFKKYSDEEKRVFDKFRSEGDALGLYLLDKTLDIEVRLDLSGSVIYPKGEKQKGREKLCELHRVGNELFVNIIKAIEDGDILAFKENAGEDGEMSKETKNYLWLELTADQREKVADLYGEKK